VADTRSSSRIFLSAGEASGDHYGAQIIAELRARLPQAGFFGLGGREMEQAELDRVVRAEDVAHMGITEVIRHMPRIYGEYRRLVASIKSRRPDVAVLIDFPDVNFRLARELKKLNIPVVYFVSPQLWAWKRRRLRWVQERVSRMMVIFPFEERFYRARGVDAVFVGHPLAELPMPTSSREEYALKYGLDPAKQWIALLPGSRWKGCLNG
jgi:lipid-A-disaccharide synthase